MRFIVIFDGLGDLRILKNPGFKLVDVLVQSVVGLNNDQSFQARFVSQVFVEIDEVLLDALSQVLSLSEVVAERDLVLLTLQEWLLILLVLEQFVG